MAKNTRDLRIRFENLESVLKALSGMRGSRQRVALRQAMNAATTPVLKTAKSLAPVRTKQLKRSIGRKTKTYSKTGTVVVVVGPRAGFSVGSGDKRIDPVKYSHLAEFGTSHSAAKPFLRPALDQNRQQFVSIMANKIDAFIAKEAKRVKR